MKPPKHKRRRTVVPPREWWPKHPPKYSPLPERDPEPELSERDDRTLRHLVRKYNRRTIAIAAEGVVPPKVGRPRRGREPSALEPLSLADTKELARVVHIYGRDVIIRGAGRPTHGDVSAYEHMHLADWLKDCAEEYRARGSCYPENDAALELHELLFGRKVAVSDAWRKTIKNKRLLGEECFRQLARQILEQPDAARALGQGLPHWLRPRK